MGGRIQRHVDLFGGRGEGGEGGIMDLNATSTNPIVTLLLAFGAIVYVNKQGLMNGVFLVSRLPEFRWVTIKGRIFFWIFFHRMFLSILCFFIGHEKMELICH